MSKDIAIIGSGPGGALAAALFAEAGHHVTIYEEAPPRPSVTPYTHGEIEHLYRNGGVTAAFGKPRIPYVESSVIGGGSEINSGLYHRLPEVVLKTWQQQFGLRLTDADLLPLYELNEKELAVQVLADIPPPSQKLLEGAQALGWKSREIPSWFSPQRRNSMSQTFLPRARTHGAVLQPGHRVTCLRHSNRRWEVAGEASGQSFVRTHERVIVAGGSIQTPWLLRQSGWRKPVGARQYLHPMLKVVAQFPGVVNNESIGVAAHQIQQFHPGLSMGCSISRRQFLALALLDHREHLPQVVENWRQHAIYYAMIAPQSSGHLRASWGEPQLRYQLALGDGQRLFEGLKKLCQALFAAGATRLYPTLVGSPVLTSDRNGFFASYSPAMHKRLQLSTVHLMGGCGMGENRKLCAIDSFGRVHGAEGLAVCDASLFNSAIGVNPQGTIMALARHNSQHLLEQWR